jgi:hypothetical protein
LRVLGTRGRFVSRLKLDAAGALCDRLRDCSGRYLVRSHSTAAATAATATTAVTVMLETAIAAPE